MKGLCIIMKKIIALILCVMMCIPLFVSCGSEDPEETPNTTLEATEDIASTTSPIVTDEEVETSENVIQTTKGFGFDDDEKLFAVGAVSQQEYITLIKEADYG